VEKVIEAGIHLNPDDTLEDAMPIFENSHTSFIPIVDCIHQKIHHPFWVSFIKQMHLKNIMLS